MGQLLHAVWPLIGLQALWLIALLVKPASSDSYPALAPFPQVPGFAPVPSLGEDSGAPAVLSCNFIAQTVLVEEE